MIGLRSVTSNTVAETAALNNCLTAGAKVAPDRAECRERAERTVHRRTVCIPVTRALRLRN